MNLSLFLKGWRQRSVSNLDAAGCPHWLIRRRCGVIIWGNILGRGSPGLLDSPGITAKGVQAAIDRLQEADDREAELRQWWQTLGLALQRQSFPRLDFLSISAGDVRDRCNTLLQQRREPHEAFMEAVFEVGEGAFVKLVRESLR